MQQKLILVSMDALIFEDLAHLAGKPSFGHIMQNGARVERVRSIYPALTYPCHATMASGCWPAKHGVVNNKALIPGQKDTAGNWFHHIYKVSDLFDGAKAKGLTTACVGWPTMACHPNIDYLVAEIAWTKAKTEEEYRAEYLRTGTPEDLWQTVCQPHVHWRTQKGKVQRFNTKVACEFIRRYQPDLLLMHLADPDRARHKYGVFAPEVKDALDECEVILAELLEAIRDSGEDYNIVVTADHGQLDVCQTVSPNALFAKTGFLTLDGDGNVTDWRAWAHSTGMSSCVYVKDPVDEPAVYALLKSHVGEGCERVFTREEAAAEGFAGDFAFVMETDGKSSFDNDWQGEYLKPGASTKGNHGYHPDKAPRPTLIGCGPAFRKGVVLPSANLVDGAPTWAKLLDIPLPDAQGTPLTELLK